MLLRTEYAGMNLLIQLNPVRHRVVCKDMPPILRFVFSACMLTLVLVPGCTRDPVTVIESRSEVPPSQSAASHSAASPDGVILGRVLLPGEGGRRGLEVHAWYTHTNGTEQQLWILPEDDGRFENAFTGVMTRAQVVAGSRVLEFGPGDLQRSTGEGVVDLGTIDLRERLAVFPIRVRAGDGSREGFVRVGLWIGSPHTGPQGELPSLGSRQFPPHEMDQTINWVLPPDTRDVYFLVERSDEAGLSGSWRARAQQLFGPFDSSSFPVELVLD